MVGWYRTWPRILARYEGPELINIAEENVLDYPQFRYSIHVLMWLPFTTVPTGCMCQLLKGIGDKANMFNMEPQTSSNDLSSRIWLSVDKPYVCAADNLKRGIASKSACFTWNRLRNVVLYQITFNLHVSKIISKQFSN